jgi:hypothetical protein
MELGCFSELALLKSNSACWSRTKWTSSSSHWKLTCSHHDIAEKLLNWHWNNNHSLTKLTIDMSIYAYSPFTLFCITGYICMWSQDFLGQPQQVNFQWDDDEVHFVLDQHAELDFFSASSLKQQSADRNVTSTTLISKNKHWSIRINWHVNCISCVVVGVLALSTVDLVSNPSKLDSFCYNLMSIYNDWSHCHWTFRNRHYKNITLHNVSQR